MLSFLTALIFVFYDNTTFVTMIVMSVFEIILLFVAAILFLGGKIGKLPTARGLWHLLTGWPTKLLRVVRFPTAPRGAERRDSDADAESYEMDTSTKNSTVSILTLRKAFSRARKDTGATLVGP